MLIFCRSNLMSVFCIAHRAIDRAPCQIDGGYSQVGRLVAVCPAPTVYGQSSTTDREVTSTVCHRMDGGFSEVGPGCLAPVCRTSTATFSSMGQCTPSIDMRR